ncbi:MAG: hypothetical protein KJZ91_02190 [Myxococcales bacterium]|nr:hypothetical protein [Myxococcales bacterium]
MSRALGAAALVCLVACGFNPGGMGADDVVDPDGGGDGDGGGEDGGDDGDGPPACVARCDGFQLYTCTGGVEDPPTNCAAGCLTDGGPHCAEVTPSNGATLADLAGVTADLSIATTTTIMIDGDDGSIVAYTNQGPMIVRAAGAGLVSGIRFRTRAQGGGAPELAIFGVRSLELASGGRLRTRGDRAVLLLVERSAVIAGAIDVGAGRTPDQTALECQDCPGAGGGRGATLLGGEAGGCAPGLPGNYYATSHETGGGGGGLGGAGGRGGDSGASVGGDITPITGCPGASLVPLEGGSGGGRGSATGAVGGVSGGGGGGALQLTALVAIEVAATADLYAGGAGGLGSASDYGGGGGGSGGAFLLEAPRVEVASGARVTANGGGGGSGREANRGENGARAAMRASGGAGTGAGGNDGRGGLGGIGTDGNQLATAGMGGADGTGGGGGGGGLVRINSVSPPSTTGAVVSPPPSVGELARQ